MDLRELLGQGIGLHEEQVSCQIEEGLGQDSFVRSRKSFFDRHGTPVEVGTVILHRLECGHIVGAQGGAELLGRCEKCGAWLCYRCCARCAGCAEILCPGCEGKLDGVSFCKKCRRRERIKRFFVFVLGSVHRGLSR